MNMATDPPSSACLPRVVQVTPVLRWSCTSCPFSEWPAVTFTMTCPLRRAEMEMRGVTPIVRRGLSSVRAHSA